MAQRCRILQQMHLESRTCSVSQVQDVFHYRLSIGPLRDTRTNDDDGVLS